MLPSNIIWHAYRLIAETKIFRLSVSLICSLYVKKEEWIGKFTLSPLETAYGIVNMFQVNSKEGRTNLRKQFWFLLVNLWQISNITLLHLKRQFLLEMSKWNTNEIRKILGRFKVAAWTDNNRKKTLDN